MEKTIKALNDSELYEVLGFGINKRSFTQKPLVGVLTDNGRTAEKREIMIGDKSFNKEIFDEFRGNKVRLILQVIQ